MEFGIGTINKGKSKEAPHFAELKRRLFRIIGIMAVVLFAGSFFNEGLRRLFGLVVIFIGTYLTFRITLAISRWLTPDKFIASSRDYAAAKLKYVFGPYLVALIMAYGFFAMALRVEENLEVNRLNEYIATTCKAMPEGDEVAAARRRNSCSMAEKRLMQIKAMQKKRQTQANS